MDLKTEWLYKEKQFIALTIQYLEENNYRIECSETIEQVYRCTPAELLRRTNALYDKHADYLMSLGGNCKYRLLATLDLIKDGVTEECSADEFQQRFIAEREAYKSTLRAFYQEEVSDGNESERA